MYAYSFLDKGQRYSELRPTQPLDPYLKDIGTKSYSFLASDVTIITFKLEKK